MGRNQSEEHSYLVNEILLELSKVPGVRVWKQVTGVFKTLYEDHVFKVGVPGQADIGGIVFVDSLNLGVVLQVEVKTGTGKQSIEQKNWQGMIETFGGLYIVARDKDFAVAFVREFIQNH